jgi:hypothetical protein
MSFGKIEEVMNIDPKSHLADKTYFRVMVKGDEGLETLLMTDHELGRVRERVKKNPEDTVMVPSWWDKISAAISELF